MAGVQRSGIDRCVMRVLTTEIEMDDPNMHAYGDHYPDDSEVPGAHPPPNHPLSRLAARLGELLDEDQWAECETLLLQGWQRDAIDRKTGADWRQNSSLEIWFPFTAEELGRWKRAAEANIGENVRLRAELDELRHNALAQGPGGYSPGPAGAMGSAALVEQGEKK